MTNPEEIGWLRMPVEEAAKIPSIRDAATLYMDQIVRETQPPLTALAYARSTTIATDSCERYEAFMSGLHDDLTITHLLFWHTMRFGCPDVPRHANEVVRLARLFFSSSR